MFCGQRRLTVRDAVRQLGTATTYDDRNRRPRYYSLWTDRAININKPRSGGKSRERRERNKSRQITEGRQFGKDFL